MNKRVKSVWTDEELSILREKYPTQGTNIPELLKTRSQSAIFGKAGNLNLMESKRSIWTDEELSILKEKYPTQGTNIPELLKTHGQISIRNKVKKLNLYVNKSNKSFKRNHNFWTAEELSILKEKYPSQGYNIPELLKTRSQYAIVVKAGRLGLAYVRKDDWTDEELSILREKYPTQGSNIPELLKTRSQATINTRAKMLNITLDNYVRWTDEELFILREKYPIQGSNIPELLKTHDRISIQNKASRTGIKNITTKGYNKWTKKEIAILKEKYPSQGCNIPELIKIHNKVSIYNKATRMGIHKN